MNYKIDALKILLNKECVLERYFPLISFKDELIKRFKETCTHIAVARLLTEYLI